MKKQRLLHAALRTGKKEISEMIALSDVIGLQTEDPTANKGLVFTRSTCFLFCSKMQVIMAGALCIVTRLLKVFSNSE